MDIRRVVVGALVAMVVASPAGARPASAQDGEVRLGGGSDIRSGTVIAIPAGTSIPAVHHVTADNPGSTPIEVRFRADAPKGISIRPERDSARIAPGTSARIRFSIHVDAHAPIGEHRVTAQLIRSDIASTPGSVTQIPAVGTSFVVRTDGEVGTVVVRAVGAETDQPVDGTLTLSALSDGSNPFEVAREDGSEMSVDVAAPGEYRAGYWLDGTELANQDVTVRPDSSVTVTLAVKSVSFLFARAEPETQDGSVVTAELTGVVQNQLGDVEGPATMLVQVEHEGERVDVVTLDDLPSVRTGITEAVRTYRPAGGFLPGTYRFDFELRTPEFTVRYSEPASFVVPEPSSFGVLPWAVGAAVAAGIGIWLHRRRRGDATPGPARPVAATPPPAEVRFETVPLVDGPPAGAAAPAGSAMAAPAVTQPAVEEPGVGKPAVADSPHPDPDPMPGVMRTGQRWPWKLEGTTWSCDWGSAEAPGGSNSASES